ncbi:hypothetical protein SNEBB_006533 [Seison nebaliae]|nr:hypothetical protein SNEBB_006533 [Seison nebaliae]
MHSSTCAPLYNIKDLRLTDSSDTIISFVGLVKRIKIKNSRPPFTTKKQVLITFIDDTVESPQQRFVVSCFVKDELAEKMKEIQQRNLLVIYNLRMKKQRQESCPKTFWIEGKTNYLQVELSEIDDDIYDYEEKLIEDEIIRNRINSIIRKFNGNRYHHRRILSLTPVEVDLKTLSVKSVVELASCDESVWDVSVVGLVHSFGRVNSYNFLSIVDSSSFFHETNCFAYKILFFSDLIHRTRIILKKNEIFIGSRMKLKESNDSTKFYLNDNSSTSQYFQCSFPFVNIKNEELTTSIGKLIERFLLNNVHHLILDGNDRRNMKELFHIYYQQFTQHFENNQFNLHLLKSKNENVDEFIEILKAKNFCKKIFAVCCLKNFLNEFPESFNFQPMTSDFSTNYSLVLQPEMRPKFSTIVEASKRMFNWSSSICLVCYIEETDDHYIIGITDGKRSDCHSNLLNNLWEKFETKSKEFEEILNLINWDLLEEIIVPKSSVTDQLKFGDSIILENYYFSQFDAPKFCRKFFSDQYLMKKKRQLYGNLSDDHRPDESFYYFICATNRFSLKKINMENSEVHSHTQFITYRQQLMKRFPNLTLISQLKKLISDTSSNNNNNE